MPARLGRRAARDEEGAYVGRVHTDALRNLLFPIAPAIATTTATTTARATASSTASEMLSVHSLSACDLFVMVPFSAQGLLFSAV